MAKMPTEAELHQIRKMKKEIENAAMLSETEDSSNNLEENEIKNESENAIPELNNETENLILDAKSKEK